MVDSQSKCTARGGNWDPVNNRCSIPEGEVSQGTLPGTLPGTPREQQQSQRELEAIRVTEQREKAARDKAAAETALDKPIGAGIDLRQSQTTATQGDGRVVQDGVPGVIENGVFFADQQPRGVDKIIFDEEGRAVGIDKADGRTLLGLSPQEVAQQAGPGAIGAEQAAEQQRIQQLISQIGQLGQLDPAVQADINFSQAATAGAFGSIPGIIGGIGVGALAGGKIGALGGVGGALVGAGVGAIGGFVAGILGNIKEQQRGELQAADIELKNARTSMRQMAMLATQNPANADVYIQRFNAQLTRVHQSRRQTKAEVSGDLNAWMEDGREQLADIDSFLQPGGLAELYGDKMAIALQSGVPLSINGEGLLV